MNRLKKELVKKGLFWEYNPDNYSNGVCLENIVINSEKCIVSWYYNVVDLHFQLMRNGEIIELLTDDGNPPF